MTNRKMALLCVTAGNTIFGFSFLFSRKVLYFTIPSVLLAARFTAAFLTLNIIVLVFKVLNKKSGEEIYRFRLKGKPLKDVFLLAIFQPCIYFICEGYGMILTSTAFTGVIIALIPIAGIVLDVFVMHSKISKRHIVCAIISVIGVVITSIGGEMIVSIPGIVILLIAVFSCGFFYVFSKKSSLVFTALEQTYVMFGCGSIVYILIALFQSRGQIDILILGAFANPFFWVSVAFLGVLSSVCAFMLINYGTRFVSISESSLLCNLTTVITILAGVFILGESFTLWQVIGAILILFSVYYASSDKGVRKGN